MNNLKPIQVFPVPAFNDNYLWLFHSDNENGGGSKQAWVVDPGDAEVILKALDERELKLAGILITHHHPDHTGGIDSLLKNFPNIPVYGPAGGSVPQVTEPLNDGDSITIDEGIAFEVLSLPGHTLDHIAYFRSGEGAEPILFCGDTLFAGGCGRLFEGTPEQMYHSLRKLGNLPDETQVYCAHEYTLANLAFAAAVEPDNEALIKRIASAKLTREQGQPTVPTTIGLEKITNPFMRSHVSSVRLAAEKRAGTAIDEESQVLAVIRSWKDNF